MQAENPTVVHLVAADVTEAPLERLRLRLGRAPEDRVIHVDRGCLPSPLPRRQPHARSPINLGCLRRRALEALFARIGNPNDPMILHAWSPVARLWAVAVARPERPLVVEALAEDDPARLVRQAGARADVYVCPNEGTLRRFHALGVPRQQVVLIREPVDRSALRRARREDLRAKLDLEPEHRVILVLPPVDSRKGTLTAVWAGLLVEQIRREVRLLIPPAGADAPRLVRFIQASGSRHAVRFAQPGTTLAEMLSAADLAVFLPSRETSSRGLIWTAAAGVPLVASNHPTVLEHVTDGRHAWLCPPDSPRLAARQLLAALEEPAEAQRRARAARRRLGKPVSPDDVAGEYDELYRTLAKTQRRGA